MHGMSILTLNQFEDIKGHFVNAKKKHAPKWKMVLF